jgi:aquaglyceroporin related protein
MADFGDFPWKKVPEYVLGQIIGAWNLGRSSSFIVFANYFQAINTFEGQKRSRTYPIAWLHASLTR